MNQTLIREFEHALGRANVMAAEADRLAYSYDGAILDQRMPGLVLKPDTTEAMGRVVALCHENGLPITVRGAGTNLSGGTLPAPGGAVLLTTALTRVIEFNEQDLYAVVEPGLVTASFAAMAAERGLFYPPDPGSQAVSTLGGNVAENAGGLRGLKYGVTGNYVMGVEFFDARGERVRGGGRTIKHVSGLNLAQLMVGSEGTLGVLSSITLRLIPPPEASRAMTAAFAGVEAASEAVAAIIAARVVPCTLEFMDNFTIKAVEDHAKAGLDTTAGAMLLVEVDGHPAQVAEEAAKVEEICRKHGATDFHAANDATERDAVWAARRAALSALARIRPTTIIEDATVPRSRIPAMVKAVARVSKQFDLPIGVFGHAGDGNLHPTILTDRRDKQEFARAEKAVEAIFDAALELGGTLSGEHGIGLAKAHRLQDELGQGTISYSRMLKRAVDPKSILNPGKLMGLDS